MKTADKTTPQDRTAEVSPLKCFCSVRVKSCRNMRSYPRCRKVKFFNYSAVERKLQLKSFFSKSDSLQCRWAAAQEKAVHFYLPLYENIRRESGVFNFARCPGWQVAPQIERSNILTAACSLLRRAAMLESFGRRSKAALTSFFYVSDTIALGWLLGEYCNALQSGVAFHNRAEIQTNCCDICDDRRWMYTVQSHADPFCRGICADKPYGHREYNTDSAAGKPGIGQYAEIIGCGAKPRKRVAGSQTPTTFLPHRGRCRRRWRRGNLGMLFSKILNSSVGRSRKPLA